MRFSLAVAVALVGMSLSGWAQQNNTFKVKPAPTKAPKSAPIGKTAASPTASTSASKELQSVERQTAKPLRDRSIRRTKDAGKGPCAEAGKKPTQSADQFRRYGRRQGCANRPIEVRTPTKGGSSRKGTNKNSPKRLTPASSRNATKGMIGPGAWQPLQRLSPGALSRSTSTGNTRRVRRLSIRSSCPPRRCARSS